MNARRPQRINKIDYGKWPDRSWLQESKQKVQDASNHKKLSTTRSHWPQEVNDCKNPKVAISWWLQEINKHKSQMTARNQQLQEIDYCQNPMTSRTNDCRNPMTAKNWWLQARTAQWWKEINGHKKEPKHCKKHMTQRSWWLQDADDCKMPMTTRTQQPPEPNDHKKQMTARKSRTTKKWWPQEPNDCKKSMTAGTQLLENQDRDHYFMCWDQDLVCWDKVILASNMVDYWMKYWRFGKLEKLVTVFLQFQWMQWH